MAIKELKVGDQRLVYKTEDLSWANRELLQDALVKLKTDNSLFGRFPLADGEDLKEWEERIKPELENESKRKDKESSTKYLSRLMSGDKTKQNLIYQTLAAIAKLFGQETKLTPESFKTVSYPSAKMFIKDLLEMYDLDTSAFE
jgi:hypothetical protein